MLSSLNFAVLITVVIFENQTENYRSLYFRPKDILDIDLLKYEVFSHIIN